MQSIVLVINIGQWDWALSLVTCKIGIGIDKWDGIGID